MKTMTLILFSLILLLGLIAYFSLSSKKAIAPGEKIAKQSTLRTQNKQSPDHIAIIVLENKSKDAIIDSPDAPYINSLVKSYSFADDYSAVAHPSLPNYLALIGGSTFGITSDCMDCFVDRKNVVDLLESKHFTWKAYMESMPASPCFVGNSLPYAQKHNPFIYFDNIRTNAVRCVHIVPYRELSTDLQSDPTTPNFIWISPNLCNDMHDCSVATGDSWLAQEVPKILSSPAFTKKKSLLIITWDEGEGERSNHVPALFIGNTVKKGYISHNRVTHYGLLHTVETLWGLGSLTLNDAEGTPLLDVFVPNTY